MTILEKINEDLKEAMKNRDQVRLNTLRMLKSKILAVDARGNIPDAEVVKLFKSYDGSLREALEIAKDANRTEITEELTKELGIIQEFLPKALSQEETNRIVKQAIEQSGAKTKKDLGLVMKAVRQLNDSIDGKSAKEAAEKMLAE